MLLMFSCAHTTAPVRVSVRETTAAGQTMYAYGIVNRPGQPVGGMRIVSDSVRQEPQLTTLPGGWTFERGLAWGTASAPHQWTVRLVTTEENPRFMLEWSSDDGAGSA